VKRSLTAREAEMPDLVVLELTLSWEEAEALRIMMASLIKSHPMAQIERRILNRIVDTVDEVLR
jgi:hypothetical protein